MEDCACETHTIKPSSSSLIYAPSWSFGLGGDIRASQHENGCVSSLQMQNGRLLDEGAARETMGSNRNDNLTASSHPRLRIDIPTVYLTKKEPSSLSYHVYQVAIKSSDGHDWSIYRRYSQFHALHQQLKTKDSTIKKLHFPPKKRLNSKASTIVQERRVKLEEYIRSLSDYIAKLPASPDDGFIMNQPSLNERLDSSGVSLGQSLGLDEELTPVVAAPAEDQGSCERTNDCEDPNDLELFDDASCQTIPSISATPTQESHMDKAAKTARLSVRGIFYEFISLDGKHDEDFDPSV